jgi:penicillin-binding protein 1A
MRPCSALYSNLLNKEAHKGEKMSRVTKSSVLKAAIRAILAVVLGLSLIFGGITFYVYKTVKPYEINLTDVKHYLSGAAGTATAAGGSAQAMADLADKSNRKWGDLSDVPKNLTNAIISTEDKNFYANNGIDYKRTLAAAATVVFPFFNVNGGGSTITQQVVKNLEGNINDRTYKIKLKEIVTAVNVNDRYSKSRIIETYVNIITLGNGCYGVQAASRLYFGKDVKDLDLAQCAVLAGIIPAPNQTYDPYQHPENVQDRTKHVLKNMLDQSMITKAQYAQAVNEKIAFSQLSTK